MGLTPFLNRHAGETAWLFGKGPSLSSFDFKTAGPLRAAINDVISFVPYCIYGFANDGVLRWSDVYKDHQTLFQPERVTTTFGERNPESFVCDLVRYPDAYDDGRLELPIDQLAEGLAIRRGTLGSALQILHIMGVKTVHLVGIDGGNTHSDVQPWRTRLRAEHWRDYNAIREAAIESAHIMGITLIFHK